MKARPSWCKVSEAFYATHTLHTFYWLDDGSCLAFFETDDFPFQFKKQHDYDLHIVLEVAPASLQTMMVKAREHDLECRGISDHGMIDSIYFRDPNGYVIELCAKRAGHDAAMNPALNGARDALLRWTAGKAKTAA